MQRMPTLRIEASCWTRSMSTLGGRHRGRTSRPNPNSKRERGTSPATKPDCCLGLACASPERRESGGAAARSRSHPGRIHPQSRTTKPRNPGFPGRRSRVRGPSSAFSGSRGFAWVCLQTGGSWGRGSVELARRCSAFHALAATSWSHIGRIGRVSEGPDGGPVGVRANRSCGHLDVI
jgi:hypothetical protein